MECKFAPAFFSVVYKDRFNRNIVECKYENYNKNKEHLDVLIETLWNVNLYEPQDVGPDEAVLIETLWNVNEEIRSWADAGWGF